MVFNDDFPWFFFSLIFLKADFLDPAETNIYQLGSYIKINLYNLQFH